MEYTVDIENMKSAVSKLSADVDSLKSQQSKMLSALNELSSMWQGESHDEYEAAYADDMEQMERLIGIIADHIGEIGERCLAYANAESDVKAAINRISL